jgi:hypothetical protein
MKIGKSMQQDKKRTFAFGDIMEFDTLRIDESRFSNLLGALQSLHGRKLKPQDDKEKKDMSHG